MMSKSSIHIHSHEVHPPQFWREGLRRGPEAGKGARHDANDSPGEQAWRDLARKAGKWSESVLL